MRPAATPSAAAAGRAWLNENDPYAAQWLRNLIHAGHLPEGDVDERSILDVSADDLAGYTACHFFAGIGGWPLALSLAGWPADRPVWTGSCPCQPFSAAGKQGGSADERHLWPAWLRLIRERRPDTILGEQVEGAVGFGWLDRVFADLEAQDYACGAAVLGAHSVGAPHIRQRLFWVANAADDGRTARPSDERTAASRPALAHDGSAAGGMADAHLGAAPRNTQPRRDGEALGFSQAERSHDGSALPRGNGATRGLAHADGRDTGAERLQRSREQRQQPQNGGAAGGLADTAGHERREESLRQREHRDFQDNSRDSAAGGLGDADMEGRSLERQPQHRNEQGPSRPEPDRPSSSGFWDGAVWLGCLDGKARRTQPGVFPLAHGVPSRVGRLRAYGNAITPQAAARFIHAVMQR